MIYDIIYNFITYCDLSGCVCTICNRYRRFYIYIRIWRFNRMRIYYWIYIV